MGKWARDPCQKLCTPTLFACDLVGRGKEQRGGKGAKGVMLMWFGSCHKMKGN